MKRKLIARQGRNLVFAACGLLIGAWLLQGCKDDTLTGQPSWLGNSIYERLEEGGNYTTMLRLIDDLGQHEVLSHTGSKTLFAANDSAFQAWYGSNPWGVKRYEQLTNSQKKVLLNNAMINNAYLIELLSNVSGTPPLEGMCMRRATAASVYDSVEIMSPDKMPNTQYWAKFKQAGKSIPILKDATTAPMIHFLPAFMKYNKITAKDLDILTNHHSNNINEAWVNGQKVLERDITCKNGYIQKVNGVVEASPNMAEILRRHPVMSMWSSLIDRFSAPYYNATATREYNRLYNNEDSVYTLRYFSSRSADERANEADPDGNAVKALLSYDPGWNHYMYSNTMNYDLHYDAGVMIVPTNEALEYWWNNEGKDLQTEYGSWDSIPDGTLRKLLNVNMLPQFTAAVPSKFRTVLNDAKEDMGLQAEDIDSCFIGCNGIVYLVNKVFSPAEYASVAYPALAHASTMNVIYWAIENLNFLPYLLSMDSQYSLILPTNEAMMWFIDPATYGDVSNTTGMETPSVLEFWYDATKSAASDRVQARRYSTTVDADGNITKGARTQAQVDRNVINDRLKIMMDQFIIVGDVQDGHEYYKSKGGTMIRVFRAPDGRLSFSGGWQIEHGNRALGVNEEEIYTKTNGKSYQLNTELPLTAQNTVYLTLKGKPEFAEFLELLDNDGSELMITTLNKKYYAGMTSQGSKNLRLLDNYNYTVYVPTSESIRKLIDDGLLPTWNDYENIDSVCRSMGLPTREDFTAEARDIIKTEIVNFLRYHVQDHSVAVGMAPEEKGVYKTAFESMKRNLETGRFFPIVVDYSDRQMTLWDVLAQENPQDASLQRHVVKTEGLYNRICRESWFSSQSGNNRTTFMASDAVVHLIDGPLFYEKMTSWRDKIINLGRN